MRSSLKWTLAATIMASVVAIWLAPSGPSDPPGVVGARVSQPSSDPYANWRVAEANTVPSAASAPLPARLPDRDVEAGRVDIFTPVTPPPPPAPPPPPPAPAPPPAPPPSLPPMNWHVLGSMMAPDGQHLVWLAKGHDEVTVKPGTALDDGYVVQSVGDNAVVLLYPPMGTTTSIPLLREQPGNP